MESQSTDSRKPQPSNFSLEIAAMQFVQRYMKTLATRDQVAKMLIDFYRQQKAKDAERADQQES